MLDQRRAAPDLTAKAQLYIQEARLTGDAGFYSLADQALACVIGREPAAEAPAVLRAHVQLQGHKFAEVEATLRPIVAHSRSWFAWATYGDALMEQGKLDAAADAYQAAVDLRPNVEVYDRIGWLRWLWGDVDGALEMQELAAQSTSPGDPEVYAWVQTRLGWLHALRGEPSPQIERALAVLPDYHHARFARGRIRLAKGEAGAAEDLERAAGTWEGARALAEADPSFDLAKVIYDDRRGYAMWRAESDPAAARPLIEAELRERQDAMTRLTLLYIRWKLHEDVTAETRALMAEGIVEPRALLYGGLILGDPALLDRALASGPGLLPSERTLATQRRAAFP